MMFQTFIVFYSILHGLKLGNACICGLFHSFFCDTYIPYARHYNPRFVYILPLFWSSFMNCDLWPYVWLVFKSGKWSNIVHLEKYNSVWSPIFRVLPRKHLQYQTILIWKLNITKPFLWVLLQFPHIFTHTKVLEYIYPIV